MFCKFCGKENREEAKFCRHCGQKLNEKATARENIVASNPFSQKPAQEKIEKEFLKPSRFHFWMIFSYIFAAILIILSVFFGAIGSFEGDFVSVFFGIGILSFFLAIIFTFFIKWWKDYKRTSKIIDLGGKKQSANISTGDLFTDFFKWKMDEKELQNQIENYNTLGFSSSARKTAAAFMIFSAVITLIFTMIGWFSSEIWIDIVLVLILSLFVYKGQKWAIIVMMIYWTISKGSQLINGFSAGDFSGGNIIIPIIWWGIFMKLFWQAYQVERARHIILQEKKEELEIIYCSKCGNKLDSDGQFCSKCGAKI